MNARTLPASRIDLTIDELVLYDMPRAGRYQIAETLERELADLIATRGVPAALQGGDLPTIGAPALRLTPGVTPEAIGRQLAHALYEGLERCTPG